MNDTIPILPSTEQPMAVQESAPETIHEAVLEPTPEPTPTPDLPPPPLPVELPPSPPPLIGSFPTAELPVPVSIMPIEPLPSDETALPAMPAPALAVVPAAPDAPDAPIAPNEPAEPTPTPPTVTPEPTVTTSISPLLAVDPTPAPEPGRATEPPSNPIPPPVANVEPPSPPQSPPPPPPIPAIETLVPRHVPIAAQSAIPPVVLALSDEELRIAATYYLQKHQTELGRKGVIARQQNMQQKLDAITAYIAARGSAQIPRLSRELNLSPGLASHYLQILVKQNKIKAEGWSKDRRYFI